MPQKIATILLAASLALGISSCQQTASTPAPAARATMTREDFKAKVLGKTPEQVIEAVGKPDKTTEGGADVYWYYNAISVDPVTGKVDFSAQVIFDGSGKVRTVSF